MVHVFETITLNASPDQVWAAIGDFNGLPDWHPLVAKSQILDGAPADQIGAVRDLTLENGAHVTETLADHSQVDRSYSYDFVESPFPITDYLSTLRVKPSASETRSIVEWESSFNTEPEAETEMIEAITGIYTSGFGALKERFGA